MSVSQADGYSEGLACEHAYMVGPQCGEAAKWVTPGGQALCDEHGRRWQVEHPQSLIIPVPV